MNPRLGKAALLFAAISILQPVLSATNVATGTPAGGSFTGGPDIINLGNLNASLSIPIRHKVGRGQDFIYDLQYNSSVYTKVNSSGTWYWQPDPNWGWQGLSPAGVVYEGYSSSYSTGTCGQYGGNSWQSWSYSGLVYADEHGVQHGFGGVSGTYISSNGAPPYCPPSGSPLPVF